MAKGTGDRGGTADLPLGSLIPAISPGGFRSVRRDRNANGVPERPLRREVRKRLLRPCEWNLAMAGWWSGVCVLWIGDRPKRGSEGSR
jgi:hypothetical protein